jgi:hypothetical protein
MARVVMQDVEKVYGDGTHAVRGLNLRASAWRRFR